MGGGWGNGRNPGEAANSGLLARKKSLEASGASD